jgi:hypothetical protein
MSKNGHINTPGHRRWAWNSRSCSRTRCPARTRRRCGQRPRRRSWPGDRCHYFDNIYAKNWMNKIGDFDSNFRQFCRKVIITLVSKKTQKFSLKVGVNRQNSDCNITDRVSLTWVRRFKPRYTVSWPEMKLCNRVRNCFVYTSCRMYLHRSAYCITDILSNL